MLKASRPWPPLLERSWHISKRDEEASKKAKRKNALDLISLPVLYTSLQVSPSLSHSSFWVCSFECSLFGVGLKGKGQKPL